MEYEFAIKKDTLYGGKQILTPVCRRKTKFWGWSNEWDRITCLYGRYTLWGLDFSPDLTYQECEDHIKGYQDVLLKRKENTVAEVEYQNLENKEI